jgi:hypothetical protein
MFYVKKTKRKCGTRGCKNIETFSISKSREAGNSIIVCKECLTEALKTIEEQYEPVEFAKAEPVKATETPTEAITDEGNTNLEGEKPTEATNTTKTRQRKK